MYIYEPLTLRLIQVLFITKPCGYCHNAQPSFQNNFVPVFAITNGIEHQPQKLKQCFYKLSTSNFFSSEHTRSRSSPVPVPVIADIGRGANLAGTNRRLVWNQKHNNLLSKM
jgi:hypothetical protein